VVGKTFTKSYRLTNHATQRTQAFDRMSSVEAYEDVSVPAGTFEAFGVKSSDNWATRTSLGSAQHSQSL
jgi:hypothetical protein